MNVVKYIRHRIHMLLLDFFPKLLVDRAWMRQFGYKVDWQHPRDINEKIQWLLIYTDTSEWSRLADKYKVREYVAEKGLENLLVRQYGAWNSPEAIDVKALPERFVLKCNHDSGSTIIVNGGGKFECSKIHDVLRRKLNRDYGSNGELHYRYIPPCIIAEELLEQSEEERNLSSSLIDYKVWCFNGQPLYIGVYYDRTDESVTYDYYDVNWHLHNEFILSKGHFKVGNGRIKKPAALKEMLESASVLSEGFPEVRVDFYIVHNKLYFGEMTFTSSGGMIQHYTKEFLKILGDHVMLPNS